MAEAIVPAGTPMPVMDVVAPPVEKEDKHEAAGAEADPVDALAAADQQAQQTQGNHRADDKPAKHAVPAAAKTHHDTAGSGVGLAITATVIIVFGLAILAVYAYIQTNK
jgi:hypothetical protein